MKLLTGIDHYNGWEYLLTIFEDGTHELASRRDASATWGPPVTLEPQSSEISG